MALYCTPAQLIQYANAALLCVWIETHARHWRPGVGSQEFMCENSDDDSAATLKVRNPSKMFAKYHLHTC